MLSDEENAAMERGLQSIGESNANVISSGRFAQTVERLVADNQAYSAERGASGVVAGRTLPASGGAVIVINWTAVRNRKASLIERLLAHEGGHVKLIDRGDTRPIRSFYEQYAFGLAALHSAAATNIDEFRIERRLIELGYPIVEQAEHSAIDDQIFELVAEMYHALLSPESVDTPKLSAAILGAMQRFTISMSYLAGALVSRAGLFSPGRLSPFGQRQWEGADRAILESSTSCLRAVAAIG